MSILVESFLANGGEAKFMESLENDILKGKNLLLFGGFVEEFASALKQKGINLSSLESQKNPNPPYAFLLHPLNFNPYPNLSHFLYEVGCEEAIVALLANVFYNVYGGDSEVQGFVQSLDIGNLASECNLSEEELEQIARSLVLQTSVIVLGKDLSTHKRARNIGRILALFCKAFPSIEIVFLESTSKDSMIPQREAVESLEELECYDGLVAYLQQKPLTEPILEVSKQFSQVGKIQENSAIKVQFLESQKEMEAKLHHNADLKGMVGILWIPQAFDLKNDWDLNDTFCYKKVKVSKVA
ncbi:hypothetical protein [Helicobacter sp.]|uniref:hypothetical protein n=1 Tax=Helicobacter sp. TaxID=218 RepID=UPI0019B3D66F|nr:hypothetical protein [Helicobacter sp.]MBD5165528.1 hypothetical protein [Helicobacter sp.]